MSRNDRSVSILRAKNIKISFEIPIYRCRFHSLAIWLCGRCVEIFTVANHAIYIAKFPKILMQYNHACSAIMDTTIVLWKIKCLNIKTLMRWSGHYESHSLYFNYPAQNKRIPHFPHHKKNIYRAINHN